MTSLINFNIQTAALVKRMLIGAAAGLVVILSFVLRVKHPNPAWGELWIIRPLIVTPLVGACAGAGFYFMNNMLNVNGWQKNVAFILSILGCIIGLWMGIILGLAGTLWN